MAVRVLMAALLCAATCAAAPKAAPKRRAAPAPAAPVQTQYRRSPYVGAVVVDAESGRVMFADSADAPAYPASVTKLMTLLLVLEDVRAGRYAFDDKVTATTDVYRCEPSWVGIKAGETMSVRDLCYALMVESANDAAIALGVHSAGTFDGFVARMNSRAAELGMSGTKYYNPNGLPPNGAKRYPWKSFNVTTASDQAKLACRMLKMPEVLEFTSVKTCDLVKTADGFRVSVTRRVNAPEAKTELAAGEKLVTAMRNHNNVMVKDKLKIRNPDGKEAVDGLKTGYIDAGGSSVVLTGVRGGRRAVVVVLGSSSAAERDAAAALRLEDALDSLSL